jgi:hypothetical protein
MSLIKQPEKFLSCIEELYQIYEEVKLITLISENLDNNELFISIINEIRNSFDHLMRGIGLSDNMEKELSDAKDHIIRAGYDAFEIIALNEGNKIIKDIKQFNYKIISAVFPDYFKTIRPTLADIQIELANIRDNRPNQNNDLSAFRAYSEKIKLIIDYSKKVSTYIPELTAAQRKQKKKIRSKYIISFVLGILSTLATFLLINQIQKHFTDKETKPNLELNKKN